MTSAIGGIFYPTGHSMIMFPSIDVANQIGHKLIDADVVNGDEVYLISPQEILDTITPTTRNADFPLPSAGTEAAAVRNYTRLAREGHAALLVKTRDAAVAEQVMVVVRGAPYSAAERYRRLVIEDL
ncbi:hypothetical protein QTH91_05815 [Variovorax dokdonensis]|uniref:Uncharacterized protein n=1 Tax=Variovorax dokdonensis TaxID=344883 RepID=A0ABT7N7Y2_9BURK|nr:hypothetical protein [Variovorax dokdonensis]MDM0043990.1 hypothetical protein [Variovorax dokdonensis]